MPHFVDGHQHCHVVPAVREALAAVFAAAGVRVTRVPSERKPPITLCPLCSVVDIEAEQARPPSLHAPLLLPLLLHLLLLLLDARAPPALPTPTSLLPTVIRLPWLRWWQARKVFKAQGLAAGCVKADTPWPGTPPWSI